MKHFYSCWEYLLSPFYFSFKKTAWADEKKCKVFDFLSFGDAFDYLVSHFRLKGGKMLIPMFYCEDMVEKYKKIFDVEFYRVNRDEFAEDYPNFVKKIDEVSPDIILIYNFFGKHSTLYKNNGWLKHINPNTIIISDIAHNLLYDQPIRFLGRNHFFIDSSRKCTSLMVSHLVTPIDFCLKSERISTINAYKIKTRVLFAVKNTLYWFSYFFNSLKLAEWANRVFLHHNAIIGYPPQPTLAYRWDAFLFRHLKYKKIHAKREKNHDVYKEELRRHALPEIQLPRIPEDEVKYMNFFPIIVPYRHAEKLVKFMHEHRVIIDRLWDFSKTKELDREFKEWGNSFMLLPYTNLTSTGEAKEVCARLHQYFTSALCKSLL